MTIKPKRNRVLEAALDYAKQGWPVIPLHSVKDGTCTCGDADCESPGKHPDAKLVRRGAKDASTDPKVIRQWFKNRRRNIGIVLDEIDLVVVDIDGPKGEQSLKSLGKLPRTAEVETGRGRHLYFECELDGPSRIGALPGLDIKNTGYVVAPPSTHASGTRYKWSTHDDCAELPDVIRRLVEEPDPPAKRDDIQRIRAGTRNNTLASMAGALRRQNLGIGGIEAALQAINAACCKPKLAAKEVSRIALSIGSKDAAEMPVMKSFDDIAAEKIDWLWHPYLVSGAINLIDGDPGVGKSQFTCWLAAKLSDGSKLPGTEHSGTPMDVLLLNAEDLPGAVIRPRLERNHADVERIHIPDRFFTLDEPHIAWLEEEIIRTKAGAVILDPLTVFMGSGVDMYRANDTRAFMVKLAEVAHRTKCAVICIRHFGKTDHSKAIHKGLGSVDFVGIARSVLGVARSREADDEFVVLHTKSNLAARGQAMIFAMQGGNAKKSIPPRLSFEGFEDLDPDEYVAPAKGKPGRAPAEREEAKAFLMEQLGDGPKQAGDIQREAEPYGITESTLRRAARDLSVKKVRKEGIWWWHPPATNTPIL